MAPPIFVNYRDTNTDYSNTSSNSFVADFPSGIELEDLLIATCSFSAGNDSSSLVPAIPSGWTLAFTSGGSYNTGNILATFYKIHTGGTQETFSITGPSNSTSLIRISAFRNVDTSQPVSAISSFELTSSSSTVVIPSITTTSVDNMIYAATHAYTSSGAPSVSWSGGIVERTDTAISGYNSIRRTTVSTADAVNPTAGPTGDQTATYSGGVSRRSGVMFAIQPPQAATVIVSDSGQGADDASITAQLPLATDAGSAADQGDSVRVSGDPDTGSASDIAAVQAVISATDTGAGSDNASVSAVVTDSDTGSGEDQGASSNTAVDSDQGTGTESDATLGVLDSSPDTGIGTDSAALSALVPVADSGGLAPDAEGSEGSVIDDFMVIDDLAVIDGAPGTSGEKATINITTEVDTGTGLDVQVIIVTVSDTGSGDDQAGMPSAQIAVSDQGSGSDAESVVVSPIFDSGSGTDSAVRSVEGVLVAPRVYTIYGTSRTYTIYRENRTREIGPHYRTYVVLSQSSVGNG